jgi:PAN domain
VVRDRRHRRGIAGLLGKDEDQLTLLGDGGCPTADGREGEHTAVSQASDDACKAQCFVANEPCRAVGFNSNNGNCEIHSEPITKYEKVDGVACYVMK